MKNKVNKIRIFLCALVLAAVLCGGPAAVSYADVPGQEYYYNKYTISYYDTGWGGIEEYHSSAIYTSFGTFGFTKTVYSGYYLSSGGFVGTGEHTEYYDELSADDYFVEPTCVTRITSSTIIRQESDDFNVGTPNQFTRITYVYPCQRRHLTETRGSLVESNIIAINGTYPDNGKHTDGFWYIKGARVNYIPALTVITPQNDNIYSESDTAVIPSISVTDGNADPLTCKYFIDSETSPRDTRSISNTATAQLVSFNALDVSTLSEGEHTLKFEITDGIAAPVQQTVRIKVDKSPPVLIAVEFSSDVSSITIAGTAEDAISPLHGSPYRYRVSDNVNPPVISQWTSENPKTTGNLTPDTLYKARFEARDIKGHIAFREQDIYTKAKTPVPQISAITETTFKISTAENNPGTTQYQINVGGKYAGQDGNLYTAQQWITLPGKSITIKGLIPNTTYIIGMKARNAGGIETQSAPASCVTLAQPPGSVEFSDISQTAVTVNWVPIPGATGYDIEVDGVVINNGTEVTYTQTGLTPETQHRYRIRVRNAGGTGNWSSYFTAYTLPYPPVTPTNIIAVEKQTEVALSWDPAVKATAYEIEADGEIIASVEETSYTHSGLAPETVHTYRIRAKNAGGESPWSEPVTKTTLPYPPPVPYNINAQITYNTVVITWAPAERATSYHIDVDGQIIDNGMETTYVHSGLLPLSVHTYRVRAENIGGKSDWSAPLNVTTHPDKPDVPANVMATSEPGSITVTWYNVPHAESYDVEIDGIQVVNTTDTAYVHNGLPSDSSHTYRVKANNITGSSAWSSPITISTMPENVHEDVSLTNITAVVTNNTIVLSWDAVLLDGEYDVEVDGEPRDNGSNTVYKHTGLSGGTYHTYRIRVRSSEGAGDWCAVLTLSTLPDLPDAPVGLEAIAANNYIELHWERVPGAAGYEVEIDGETIDNGENTSYRHEGLAPGTSHIYRVRAKNIAGVTAWSDALIKSTTSPTYTVECSMDEEFNLSLIAMNVQDFTGLRFIVTYNEDELDVVDLYGFTPEKDRTSEVVIPGTNIYVEHTPGRIEFTVYESIAPGTSWSGELTGIIFKSKITGQSYLDFLVE